tara:strand:+ start:511 stop:732 length:222 start_codon:yes stop_codon:yes gene_type:complete
MISEKKVRHSIIGGIALNLVVQALMLVLLAYSGEWRVWRFLFNAVAQIDAIFVFAFFVNKFFLVTPKWDGDNA